MESELKFLILYYARVKYYQTAQTIALDGIKKFPNDVSFKAFLGFSLVLSGRYQEGIRELTSLQTSKDVNIGAILALIYAHRLCQTVDRESIQLLDEKLKLERKTATETAMYFAALFLFYQNKYDKSRDYLEKSVKHHGETVYGLCLRGWIDLMSENTNKIKTASSSFKICLEKEKKNLDAFLGLAKVKELEGDFVEVVAILNQVIVKNNNFLPSFIEKMKAHLSLRDWDQAIDTATRILNTDGNFIEALKMKGVALICRDGNFAEGTIVLKRLYSEMEKCEPRNAIIYRDIAQLFASVCCRNANILQETYRFAEKAAHLEPANANFVAELGYQNIYLGKYKEAVRYFKNATKLDESSVDVLMGLILSQIHETGVNENIKQQVEFLMEVQIDNPTSLVYFMSAKMCVMVEDALAKLRKAAEIQIVKARKYTFGVQFIQQLDGDFLIQIAKETMKWILKINSESSKTLFGNALFILEEVREACPGLTDPHFELARVYYLSGNLNKAKDALSHILDNLDASLADGHILMAQIHLKQNNYALAARSLEVALSYNFQVRDHPLYHFTAAMVQKENKNIAAAERSLKTAMDSPIFKNSLENRDSMLAIPLSDKSAIYLELVRVYQAEKKFIEAEALMDETRAQFKGTAEEGRVMVAAAEVLLERGNVTAAIDALEKIQPGETFYPLAKRTLADIYLKHRRNRDAFAQCYKDLVSVAPSRDSYEDLGDAFAQIQEPDLAIEAYEEALKYDVKNNNIICKIGKALVKTHHFSKAINYYKDAIKNEDNPELLYDMAELYFKLGQLDNAERVLLKHIGEKKAGAADNAHLTWRTKLLQLLAKIRDKSGSLTDSLAALKDAKENHCAMDKQTLSGSDTHKAIVVTICTDTALLLTRLRDFAGAVKSFKEALNYGPNDEKVLVGLARVYMQTDQLEECQVTCKHLLAANPENEPATVMLADIAFTKVNFETSALHFKQLLVHRPDYWVALARLIEVMRRVGSLEEAKQFIDKAEAHCSKASQQSGLHYCRGLYDWYNGESQTALTHFNRARLDNEWGQQAIYNMIEICVNPDHDTLGGEAFSYDADVNELPNEQEDALKTAQRLLMELKPRKNSEEAFSYRLLEIFWLLATRQKSNIDKALQDLTQLSADDYYKEHPGVGLGVATAFMLQKQVQKARNRLKLMVKSPWRFEEAEYLERSWLLLTDIYIGAGKSDLAADLIERVLEHNKSCYKAYEYAGYISEKEQLYKEAAFQYEKAWKYNGKCNPAVGYKLAFNYMKAKCYADAIDICHAVLKLNPDYPRIQKEILEKSRNHLRT